MDKIDKIAIVSFMILSFLLGRLSTLWIPLPGWMQ
jgi:hypothetical protein